MATTVEDKARYAHALYERVKRTKGMRRHPVSGERIETLLMWTIRARPMLDPTTPFDLVEHKYLKALYEDGAPRIVVKKAGQIGVSEWAISRAFYTCDVLQGNVFYVMPTSTDVSDFSQMRFGPALEESPYLLRLIVDASTNGKRGTDRVTMKRVRDNFIVFRGGQVDREGHARQLRSVPADLAIRDEVDEMNPRVKQLVEKRLGHSLMKEHISISTPSYPNMGIDKEWHESDQREWHVPCPHCGQRQQISIDQVVIEWDDVDRPVAWYGMEEDRAYAACVSCQGELNRLADGEWVPKYPDRDIVGYHPTKLISPRTPLIEVVSNLDTVDEGQRKEAFNQDLAEVYAPRGSTITADELDACKREYAHGPRTDVNAVAGIDVGKVFHVVIRGLPTPDSTDRPQLFAGEVVDAQDLPALLKRYGVRTVVIDALPETRVARQLQASFTQNVVWLAYYRLSRTGLKKESPVQWNYKETLIDMDRTRTLDETYSRFVLQENTLPGNIRALDSYYGHLQNLVRVQEEGPQNTPVTRYVQIGDDHYAHAENYCYAASLRKLGWARS